MISKSTYKTYDLTTAITIPHREYFSINTLIDITDSGCTDIKDRVKYHQAQNLNVFSQVISLRAQPTILSVSVNDVELTAKWFGSFYTEVKCPVWCLIFCVEHRDIWTLGDDPVGLLLQDLHGVVITDGLTERATLLSPVIDCFSQGLHNTIATCISPR